MLHRTLPTSALWFAVAGLALGACNILTGADDLEVEQIAASAASNGSGPASGAGAGNPGATSGNGEGGAGSGNGGGVIGGAASTDIGGGGAGVSTGANSGGSTNASTSGSGGAPPACGDGTCNGGETCATCELDCGMCPPTCGNNVCDAGETCSNCAADCGACPPMCGDGTCNGAETCSSCPADCGACPPMCGDGSCNGGETCTTCQADCGPCAPVCGDGTCNGGETCMTCQGDCGPCPVNCQGAGPATTPLDSEEQAFLSILNNYRAMNGLGALSACTSLNRAAQGHSENMRDQNFFSHTGLDGSSPWDRCCDACYDLGCGPQTAMAENIAAGNSGAQATFDQWKNSPGHNANMLGSAYTVIGIGRATGGGMYGTYWTTDFGGATEPSCN